MTPALEDDGCITVLPALADPSLLERIECWCARHSTTPAAFEQLLRAPGLIYDLRRGRMPADVIVRRIEAVLNGADHDCRG